MLRISSKFASSSWATRSAAVGFGLFLLSAVSLPTGCMSYSLTGLTIEPAYGDTCIYGGGSAQYHAYGTYTEGGHSAKTEDVTDSVSWSLNFPAFGSISSSGLLTTSSDVEGTSDVVATAQGEFGELHATSNIEVPCPSSTTSPALSIVPAASTLTSIGDVERPLAIAVRPAEPRVTDVTARVTWASANPAVATVDSTGRIAAVGPGSTTITATQKLPGGATISGTQTVQVQGGSPAQ